MTSEICLMNRYAAVLAADSATTIRHWTGNGFETRYFKGANKIFQLSDRHPVAVMINNAAHLEHIPWEVIVKEFRNQHGRSDHRTLEEWITEFFSFIKHQREMFPEETLGRNFVGHMWRASTWAFAAIIGKDHIKACEDQTQRGALISTELTTEMARVMALPLPDGLVEADIARAKEKLTPEFLAWLQERIGALNLVAPVTAEFLVDFTVNTVFRQFTAYADSTGLVFAGYGSSEFMPSFISFNCFGHIYMHLHCTPSHRDAVTEFIPSVIRPFAQTSMIDTFVLGFSQDATAQVHAATISAFKELTEKISADFSVAIPDTFAAFVAELEQRHRNLWTKKLIESHADPVRRVIGSLPVDEMAELAETLILLQSLKEKVTLPSASVSGPIDVAAITKSDGFVWIKRKHYFNPSLNPRFFQRQQARYLGT